MIEKIVGKHKSLQRNLVKEFILVFLAMLIVAILVFYLSVNKAVTHEIQLANMQNRAVSGDKIFLIVQRSVLITIISSVLFVGFILRYSTKKILTPINKINNATKQIAAGNFDISLESSREDEIGELTRNFNLMAKDLSKIEVIQKDFINNVSHEIKTPISSIKGFAELIKMPDTTDEEKNEYIDIIVEESDRLLNISTNILKLSNLQNKEVIEKKDEVNISSQLKKAKTMLESKAQEKKIKINIDKVEEITIKGNEELLFQVWTNIIDNSIKFTNENGTISLISFKKNGIATIKIQDNGIGMTEDEKRKIFEKFYQADQSHYSEGSGLGLSIVKKIVKLSGGTIKIDTKKGKGTTFIIELPDENLINDTTIKIN